MKRWLLVPLIAAAMLAAATPALAGDWSHHRDRDERWNDHSRSHDRWDSDDEDDSDYDDEDSDSDDDSDSDESSDDAISESTPGTAPVVVSGAEKSLQAALTGYSWQDNTPAGSADICCAVLHQKAGGTGTYADPITTAVAGSGSSMIFKAGTRFYIPQLKRYVIVEDSGASSDSLPHLDIWVGGQGHSKSDSDACMNSYTGNHQIIQNPAPGHPVTSGELTTAGGCKI